MQEIRVLKTMLEFDTFAKYSTILFKIPNLEKSIKSILTAIAKYYRQYPDRKTISLDELETHYLYLYPVADMDPIRIILENMREVEIDNSELLITLLNQVVEYHISGDIAQITTEVLNGTRSGAIEDVQKLLAKYDDLTGLAKEVENDVCALPIRELFASVTGQGLAFKLPFLHNTYGLVRPGTVGHIFARPDVGKTSLALSELVHFASQLSPDRPGLYLNNEEGINRIKARAMTSMLGKKQDWIMSNYDKAQHFWEKGGGENLKFIGSISHINQVRQKLETFDPRVIIIDQGPKIQIYGDLEGVQRLQVLYNMLRELATKYDCSIITLGQADAKAEGRKFLSLNNIADSKVSIQGELDWCVGIGATEKEGYENVRYFNSCKNKLTGLYGRWETYFDIDICRFKK